MLESFISAHNVLISAGLLILAYIFIATEKIPKVTIASLGACLGGNLTIIGAAANVIVSENSAKEGYPISFMQFLKYGSVIVGISLFISTLYMYMKYLT